MRGNETGLGYSLQSGFRPEFWHQSAGQIQVRRCGAEALFLQKRLPTLVPGIACLAAGAFVGRPCAAGQRLAPAQADQDATAFDEKYPALR